MTVDQLRDRAIESLVAHPFDIARYKTCRALNVPQTVAEAAALLGVALDNAFVHQFRLELAIKSAGDPRPQRKTRKPAVAR